MKSIFAITMMLAAAATSSAEYMSESQAQLRQFTEYEEFITEEEEMPRRLGWGGGSKGSKGGWGGSSKGSKGGSSKSSKSSSSCDPEIIYKYIYVPVYPDDSSSGKSGKGSYGSGKSGKGSYGSGKSGKGSYGGWGGSGKSGKGSSGGWGGSGKSGKGSSGGWW